MNLTDKTVVVIGANGRTGRLVVDELIKHGYFVRAFVYKGNFSVSNGQEIQGNIMNYQDVDKAVAGVFAVVSVVGHGRNTPPDMQTKGIANVIKAMHNHQAKRLISLTGSGVRDTGDKITLIDRFLNAGISLIDPQRVKDGIDHANLIKQSQLDWTIVRVLKLANHSFGRWRLTPTGPVKMLTARADVAKAIVKVLNTDLFIRQMPLISKH